jgi:hypothetical protein
MFSVSIFLNNVTGLVFVEIYYSDCSREMGRRNKARLKYRCSGCSFFFFLLRKESNEVAFQTLLVSSWPGYRLDDRGFMA